MANYVAHLQPELAVNYCQLVVVWVDDPASTRAARQELRESYLRRPNPRVATAAATLNLSASPGFLANHSFRAFAWGAWLGWRDAIAAWLSG